MQGERRSCGVWAYENSCAHTLTWSRNKLWRSTSIFNLWVQHRSAKRGQHRSPYGVQHRSAYRGQHSSACRGQHSSPYRSQHSSAFRNQHSSASAGAAQLSLKGSTSISLHRRQHRSASTVQPITAQPLENNTAHPIVVKKPAQLCLLWVYRWLPQETEKAFSVSAKNHSFQFPFSYWINITW
jgi:hypothetical protein